MEEEIKDLKRKLKARKDRPGYGDNVAELERSIAELEAVNAG